MSHHDPKFDQYLGRGRPSGGGQGEYRYVCPWCKDKEQSLAVNFTRKMFMCFRASCAKSGSLSYLARNLGFAYDDDVPVLSSIGQLRHRLWGVDDGTSEIAPNLEVPVHIPELQQIQPGSQAWNYLIERGLTPHDIYYNQCSLSPEDRFSRIYFPQCDSNGRVIFWVSRKYLPGAKGRRYNNPGGAIKKKMLYRSHLVDRNYPISVCEGPISAIVAGNAVATMGVLYSQDQTIEIARLGAPILSAMDGEAFTKSLKLARDVQKHGGTVAVVPLPPRKDPADVGRAEYYRYASLAFRVEPGAVQDVRERLARAW